MVIPALANNVNTDIPNMGLRVTWQTVTSSGNAVAVDCESGYLVYHLLTENTTVGAPSNPDDGEEITFLFKQAAAGSKTVAFNAVFKLVGAAYTMTATANKLDLLKFVYRSADTAWYEVGRNQNMG